MRRKKINNSFSRRVLTEKIIESPASQIHDKRQKIHFIEQEINELVKKFIPDHHSMFYAIGTWKCKESPIGLCYYNEMEDPAMDHCLFCHNPHERK